VATKERFSDRDVRVHLPEIDRPQGVTPVFVDDIVSTGNSLSQTIQILAEQGWESPICVAAHGIFAEGAFEKLMAVGAKEIVTSDSVPHHSNRIDLAPLLASAILADQDR